MDLKQRITDDMKAAMRAKDQARLETIRMLRAAIQRREVDEQISLDDDGVITVIQKQIKQSQDAIAQFAEGDRPDLVDKERQSVAVLRTYLPEPLSESEIDALIEATLDKTAAQSMRDMGKVMGLLKAKLQGRADMATVSTKIKARLKDG